MQVKVSIRGVEAVQAFIRALPRGTVKVGLQAFTEYIIGNMGHGLKHYQPYKYISLKKAYGGFASDKQRRYVMARIREGSIDPGVPHRTGNTQRAWTMVETNGGYGYTIKNPTEGAYFTASDEGQANLNALAGWRKVSKVIEDNLAGAMRHALAAVNAYLKG